MISTISFPAFRNKSFLSACVAKTLPLPGSPKPKASTRQFIELAVNIPEHEPQVGQADRSTFSRSSSDIESSAARPIASTKSNVVSLPLMKLLPASIGPPETKIVGMFKRIVAINIPGVILSQFERHTKASAQCALTMYSTASAMSSLEGRLYNMPE